MKEPLIFSVQLLCMLGMLGVLGAICIGFFTLNIAIILAIILSVILIMV